MESNTPHRPAPDNDVRLARFREQIGNGLWPIPATFVVGAMGLALVLQAVDERLEIDLAVLFDAGAATADSLLTTIATSIMTFTSLVISVTVVALQLASQQFSPRVLRTFFRDTGTKVALGIFVGTFVYALMVLRQVDPGAQPEDLPRISITVAFVLLLVSLGTFVYYVDHVAHAIRIVSIMDSVAAETRGAIRVALADAEADADQAHGLVVPDRPADLVLTSEQRPGAVTTYDEDDLVAVATRCRCTIRLVPVMGQFVPSGAALAEVWSDDGSPPSLTIDDVLPHIGVGRERTMAQDPAFGFRQLVDIAEKALSPGINDPTTAVQALDRIHDLLRRVAAARLPSGHRVDAAGHLRLIVPVVGWDPLVALACDEIRHYGAGAHQVQRKMRVMLDDLLSVVDEDRRAPLERQSRLLDAAVERLFPDADDQDAVRRVAFEC